MDESPPQLGDVVPLESRRELIAELSVVLMIGAISPLYSSLVYVFGLYPAEGESGSASFKVENISHVVSSLTTIAAMLWILYKASPNWHDFGFKRFRIARDPFIGFALFVSGYIAYVVLAWIFAYGLYFAGLYPSEEGVFESGALAPPLDWFDLLLVPPMAAANAFAEQLVITAYLVTRLGHLFKKRTLLAPAIATLIFASYHSYQGTWGVVNAVAVGGIFTLYFFMARRIWPCVAAHFLMDFVPYFLEWAFPTS